MIPDREMIKTVNQLTRNSPFYQKFNERRYSHLKGYIDHDEVMFSMARLMTNYQYYDSSIFERDFTHTTSLIVLDRAYHQGFGSYWLAEKLFDAFCNSQLPATIGQIKRVIPSGVLLLPPKLKNPDGQFLKWVCFHHRLGQDSLPPIALLSQTLDIQSDPEDCLSWFTVLDDGTQYGSNRHLKIENHQIFGDDNQFYMDGFLEENWHNTDSKTEKESPIQK